METVKFQLSELLGIGMTLVVLGIGLAYGLQVLGDVRDDIGVDSCAARSDYVGYNATSQRCYNTSDTSQAEVQVGTAQFNGTTDSITAVAKLPEKLPTIVTVIVAAVIIGILVTYLWARFR